MYELKYQLNDLIQGLNNYDSEWSCEELADYVTEYVIFELEDVLDAIKDIESKYGINERLNRRPRRTR